MELNRIEKMRLKLEKEGKTVINLSAGTSAVSGGTVKSGMMFPPEILAEGFAGFQQNPLYHPDPKGSPEARKAVSGFYARRGFNIAPENIILTSGTSESYLHLFKLLAKPGEEILFPNPGYPLFDHLAALAGTELKHYGLDAGNEWQVDLNDLEANMTRKTRAIVLVSPNNPTGSVLAGRVLGDVLSIAKKYGIPVISDEVFSEFVFDGKIFPRAAALMDDVTVFTLNGISKTYALPGLKISWIGVTGPGAEKYLDELELSVDTLLACNQMSQAMLPSIIAKGEHFLGSYRKHLEQNRNLACRILSRSAHITFMEPRGGCYLFARIHGYPGTDEDFVVELMERAGIYVHPGYFYDYEKGLHVLVSFVMEATLLQETLEKFVDAVDLLCAGHVAP